MRKLNLLILVAALWATSFNATGQPVLDSIEDYTIGQSRTYVLLMDNPVQEIPTGPETTWDYSDLAPIQDTTLQKIVKPEESTKGGSFDNVDFAEVQVGGLENYFERSGNTNVLQGNFQDDVLDEGVKINYTEPFPVYKRPFAYSDTVADSGRRSYVIQSLEYEGAGYSQTYALGWGTLILPYDTFENVVLIKNLQTWEDESAFAPNTENKITTYRWYQPDKPHYLLTVDSFIFNNSLAGGENIILNTKYYTPAAYQSSIERVGGTNGGRDWIHAYVSGNQLMVKPFNDIKASVKLELFNYAGKSVKTFEEFSLAKGGKKLDLRSIKPGAYMIKGRLEDRNGKVSLYTKKIIVH